MLCRLSIFILILPLIQSKSQMSVEEIQKQNLEILHQNLEKGWKAFCDSPVDEGVMSLYHGINPSDATIHVMTINNQSIELPIKALSEIRDFDINPKKKTLLYVNAFYAPDSVFGIKDHLELLQRSRRDLNVIIVDFAKNIEQLYYSLRHHVAVNSYFVYKILNVLVENGIAEKDISLVGHSVGANIAALSSYLYIEQFSNKLDRSETHKIGQLIAVDPAIMCDKEQIYVNSTVSERVVVIHGEGNFFGLREPRGTLDIYPNGVGFFPRHRSQPGCDTNLCSHMYPFLLFMEAMIEGAMIPAVKCGSWLEFRRGQCQYNDRAVIGLVYPAMAEGTYFCLTRPNPPYTFMEYGLRFKNKEIASAAPIQHMDNSIRKRRQSIQKKNLLQKLIEAS